MKEVTNEYLLQGYRALLIVLAEKIIDLEQQSERLKVSKLVEERRQGKFIGWHADKLRLILSRNGAALKKFFGTKEVSKICGLEKYETKMD